MLIALCISIAAMVPSPAYTEVARLRLNRAFWPNLHHTLCAASLPAAGTLGSPAKGPLRTDMTTDERAAWDGAVSYHAREFAAKDRVIDRGWPSQRGIVEARLKPYVDTAGMPMDAAMNAWLQDGRLFAFRSGFWANLHHFLYVLGRARSGAPDSRRAAVVKAPTDIAGLSERPEDERAAWDESLHYYAGTLSTKDVIFDAGLAEITRKLAAAPDDADPSTLGLPPELAGTLRLAAPVYRAVWWPRHSRANAARRDELGALAATYGAAAVARLTSVYRTRWPARPRVVDVVAYSNWAGAYSVTGGIIAVSSLDEATGGILGLETLLHESSHQWDDEIEARLSAIAKAHGKLLDPQLSHALIFHTSGEIVAGLVPGHVPYAVKYGLWNRQGMAEWKPLLDQYWRPYIRGGGTFEEAAAGLVEARQQPPV